MGTGKFQSSNRCNAPRLIHAIGLALFAVLFVSAITLTFAGPAIARDGHGGHEGGNHFEPPKMVVAPQPQSQPQQRQMRHDDEDRGHRGGGNGGHDRQDDQKQNSAQPQRVEERGHRDGGQDRSKENNSSSSQTGSEGAGSQTGGSTTSEQRPLPPTGQAKPTDGGSSSSSGPTSSGSLGSQSSDDLDRSDRKDDRAKPDRNGQSSQDHSAPKPQRGDNSGDNGAGDDKKRQDSKTTERGKSDQDSTPAVGPVQQQEDRSFGASTSVLDFFRRNTNESPSTTPAAPVAPAATANGPVASVVQPFSDDSSADGKSFGRTEVKPAKATATPSASTQKAVDKAKPADKSAQAANRVPPVEIPFADPTTFKPHEIVASNLSAAQLQRAKSLGFAVPAQTLIGNLGLPSVQRLVVPAGMSEVKAYALLKQEVPSATFSANHVYRILPAAEASERPAGADAAALAPGATSTPCTWEKCFGPTLIGWTPEHRTCARRVRIGIIDTSFDLTHPAFAGHKFSNGNFLGDGTTSARDWHGTAVLGLLAGDSRGGTPGLVPDADFYLASAFRTDAEGNASADTISVLNALSWLQALDVKLINMSFSGPHDELIEKAIGVMSANGVIFVAAAGNRGPHAPPSYPAAYSDVIAVTAVGRSLQGYRHANSGDYVDAAAPGVEVWTSLPNAREGFRTGTSFAAPFFTGIVATLPTVQSGKMRKADVLNQLAFKDLGAPGRDPVYGQGLAKVPEHCSNPALIARGQNAPQQTSQPKMSVGAPAVSPALPASAPRGAPKVGTAAEAASGPPTR